MADLLQGPLVTWARVYSEDVDGRKEWFILREHRCTRPPRGTAHGLQVGRHERVSLGAVVLLD
eukprot:8267986-Pyramimonas_sp.AAC.1